MLKNKKNRLLILSLVAVLLVGGTLAFIFVKTGVVANTFNPAKVGCEVLEDTFNGVTKTNVRISNPRGDEYIEAYYRAKIVVTWKKEVDANLGTYETYAIQPEAGVDYEMSMDSNKWQFAGDDFYYYTESVSPGEETDNLIERCVLKQGVTPPEGYFLSVEILAEGIQADGVNTDGEKAVVDAWGVDPSTLQ